MQLIYRGQSFTLQAVPAVASKVTGTLTRTLLYPGRTYCCKPVSKITCLPRAINWRYDVPRATAATVLNPAH